MIFKIIYHSRGEHVHCSLFVSPVAGATYAKAGHFVLRRVEWEPFKRAAPKFIFEARADFEVYQAKKERA